MTQPKKNKKSGGHKTPRQHVVLPEEWVKLAEKWARKRPLPVSWYIIQAIRSATEAEGETEFPPFPWDKKTDKK